MAIQLNDDQRKLVENNMGLVGKVIKDRVHGINGIGIFSYDDLFQIGAVGLCKAAATHDPINGRFSTYAYLLIRNEIFNALEYATARKNREELIDVEGIFHKQKSDIAEIGASFELKDILESSIKGSSGTTRKGIIAILLMSQGYTCREIGERMGVPTNNVTAYVSKARKYLKEDFGMKRAV